MTAVSYAELPVVAALAPWAAASWMVQGTGGGERVLPDGCIDLVWTRASGLRVVGANSVAFVEPLAAGDVAVGLRFRVGAAGALLGIRGEAVRDARLPAGEVCGEAGRRLAEAVEAPAPPDRRLATLQERLVPWSVRAQRPDPLVRAAVARLEAGTAGCAALAHDLGVSERGLRRRVTAAVGYGPKRLDRVLRLGRALFSEGELARRALDAGYCDQAHFSNECVALAGVTPGRFLQDRA